MAGCCLGYGCRVFACCEDRMSVLAWRAVLAQFGRGQVSVMALSPQMEWLLLVLMLALALGCHDK